MVLKEKKIKSPANLAKILLKEYEALLQQKYDGFVFPSDEVILHSCFLFIQADIKKSRILFLKGIMDKIWNPSFVSQMWLVLRFLGEIYRCNFRCDDDPDALQRYFPKLIDKKNVLNPKVLETFKKLLREKKEFFKKGFYHKAATCYEAKQYTESAAYMHEPWSLGFLEETDKSSSQLLRQHALLCQVKNEYAGVIAYVSPLDISEDDLLLKISGNAFLQLGKYRDAIANFAKWSKREPKNDVALTWLAMAFLADNDAREAITYCDEAIKLNPTNDAAWVTRGEAKWKRNQIQDALADVKQGLKINPQNEGGAKVLVALHVAYMRSQQESFKKSAKVHHDKGEYSKAIPSYDDLLGIDPKDISLLQLRAEAKTKMGLYEAAIPDLDEVIKVSPKNEAVWMARGEAKRALGRYEEAIQDLMEVIKLNPENSFAKECLKEARRKLKEQQVSTLPVTSVNVQESPVFNSNIKFSMAIPKDQLKFERRLGEGSFGEVHKGTWSPTSLYEVPVAIKRLKNTSMSTKVLEDFRREVEIQAKLNSVGVVKLLGITSEQPYCMVMEFMERGSLRDLLDSQKQEELHWDIRIQIANNIAVGLAYLHGQNPIIIHGDLKSLNILVNGKGEAKLADFGLAALKTESRSKEYVDGNTNNKGPKGSLLWIAPELLRMNGKRSPATDVFSLAVVFWELASHLFPYEGAHGDMHLIQSWIEKGERETFDERTLNTPKEYVDLTQRCWDAKPENRPNAQMIVIELEKLYTSTPLAPTLFASPPRPAISSGGYMTNSATGSTAPKSSSGYLVKSVVPLSPPQTMAPKAPPRKSLVENGEYLVKSSVPAPTSSSQVPPKGPYMGNVYK